MATNAYIYPCRLHPNCSINDAGIHIHDPVSDMVSYDSVTNTVTRKSAQSTIDSDINAAIIYSGKSVGHWNDNLSKGVKDGTVTRLLLDLLILKELLNNLIAQEANKAVKLELDWWDELINWPEGTFDKKTTVYLNAILKDRKDLKAEKEQA